jgi:hypothetical protein
MTDLATDLPTLQPPAKRRRWVSLVKTLLLLLVLAAVGYALWQQWRRIGEQNIPITIRPLPLIGALLSLVGVATVQAISYRTLLGAYASPPRWRTMPTIAWVPPIGKYIPGGAVFAAVAMLRRFAVPAAVAVAVVLVQDGLAVLAGLITGAPLLLWQPVREKVPWGWVVAIPAIVAGAVCLWPGVFGRLINLLLRKLKREPLQKMPSAAHYIVPLLCAFAQWVLAGACLLLLIDSVTGHLHWRQFPLLVSFAALSQTIGYLVLFAPGGMGVREAILLVCLPPLPGVGPLAAVIVPIRAVAQIVVDLSLAAIGLIALRNNTGRPTIGRPVGNATHR